MNDQAKIIQRVYLILTFMSTLSASLIWGINTLFLLDAGLNNLEAFAANAFFTAGQVVFDVPTGVIADSWGRRTSYLLGTITLAIATLAYVLLWQITAPFWVWGVVSVSLGLGFTFFSGAMDAWLIDALAHSDYKGRMDPVFAKAQMVNGAAMLLGSVAGGVIAQFTNLGVPFVVRCILLIFAFGVAFIYMKDLGFTPMRPERFLPEMHKILKQSAEYGLKNRPVRWLMLTMPFTGGVAIYAFYALQPYLLELYGNPNAYWIAGLAAAAIAGTQIVGGFIAPFVLKLFKHRTTVLFCSICIGSLGLLLLGLCSSFYLALFFIVFWALSFAIGQPVYLTLINALIPSRQRATILSFNNLMGSMGGVITQPALGKAADVFGYATTYIMTSGIALMAVPFILLERHEKTEADHIDHEM